MQLQNLKASKSTANPKLPEPFLQNHPLTSIQNHFFCFLQKISGSLPPKPLFLPLFPQNPSSLKTQFDNTIQTIGNHAKQALRMGFSPFPPPSHPFFVSAIMVPGWRNTSRNSHVEANKKSSEAIKKCPKGITVYGYALKNSVGDFVWLPDVKTGRSLGLFFFKREDAEVLLKQVKDIEPSMRDRLRVDKATLDESQNLSVMIGDKRYHPVFFTKEDLDNSLKASHQQNSFNNSEFKKGDSLVCVLEDMIMGTKSLILVLTSQGKPKYPIFFRNENLDKPASHQQKDLIPLFRKGDNQDCSLEKIVKEMKESPPSKWDKIIFIPPGGTDVSQ